MNKNMKRAVSIAVLAGTALLAGCATSIKASSTQNPAPPEAFSSYGRIVLKPVVFREGYKSDVAGLAKIDENMKKQLGPAVDRWNARGANGRTLVIAPVIEELSFKHGAKRILLGPLAGSSGVLMHVTFTDGNGKLVANPEFFQRAAAMGAGYTFGVHDNLMLTRVAELATRYVVANYDSAVGGPTGADEQAVK